MKTEQTFPVKVAKLPDWGTLDILPHGTFREFTLNTPNDAQPAHYNSGNAAGILANWCGSDLVPEFGTMGGICYNGGGEHIVGAKDVTLGNLVLDIGARKYVWRNASNVYHTQCINMTGDPTDDFGCYLSDGTTQSTHTYGNIKRVPASWGITGPQGGIARVACNNGSSFTQHEIESYASTTVYDLEMERNGHFRLTGDKTYSFPPYDPSYSQGASAAIDLRRKGWWACAGNSPYLNFTYSDGTFVRFGPFSGDGWGVGNQSTFIQYDQARDTIIFFSAGFNGSMKNVFLLKDPTVNTVVTFREIDGFPAGDGIGYVPDTTYPAFCGPMWSTLLNCWVAIHDGSTTGFKILKIRPSPDYYTGNWTCEIEQLTNAPGDTSIPMQPGDQSVMNGSWGKLVECVPLRAFAWTRNVWDKGQLLRPHGV